MKPLIDSPPFPKRTPAPGAIALLQPYVKYIIDATPGKDERYRMAFMKWLATAPKLARTDNRVMDNPHVGGANGNCIQATLSVIQLPDLVLPNYGEGPVSPISDTRKAIKGDREALMIEIFGLKSKRLKLQHEIAILSVEIAAKDEQMGQINFEAYMSRKASKEKSDD